MAYLEYLIHRAGVPPPARICVVCPVEEWANRQIADELDVLWPEAAVTLVEDVKSTASDLLVIPVDGDLPSCMPMFNTVLDANWIIFYGLAKRQIWVFRTESARDFSAAVRRSLTLRYLLSKTKLARPVKECLILWKRLLDL